MTTDPGRKRLPPYISYKTFENFIGRLQGQVPSRIDRSYWGDAFSGSTGTQLMAALRFLNLVDGNGKPTNEVKQIAAAKGFDRPQAMKEMTFDAYDFVLKSPLDLQNATYDELQEVFHQNFQLTPDVCRKCIKFFISLASTTGTSISPWVTKRVRSSHSTTGTAVAKYVQRKIVPRNIRNEQVPQVPDVPEIVPQQTAHTIILAKFPTFDPAWADEVKVQWFQSFDELLKRFPLLP